MEYDRRQHSLFGRLVNTEVVVTHAFSNVVPGQSGSTPSFDLESNPVTVDLSALK